jgi:hypothetical protein
MTQPTIARDTDGTFTKYAWPGGYPVYHICDDGGVLCPMCANDPSNPVTTDTDDHSGWQIVASDVNWEDNDLTCDHCGQKIESAYAE